MKKPPVSKMKNHYHSIFTLFFTIFFFTLLTVSIYGQKTQEEDLTQKRDIIADVFTRKRPSVSRVTKKEDTSSEKKKTYKLAWKQSPRRPKTVKIEPELANLSKKNNSKSYIQKQPSEISIVEQLGITMWQLRNEQQQDTGARLLTLGKSNRFVAERVSLDTRFRPKDKVRISIESPRAGYLYIIDREKFVDGTLGKPYLIFPTLNARNGNNYVTPGKPVEIPAQTDDPFYFEITPVEDNYAGEFLTVILSPAKLPNLQITNEPLELESSLVEEWEEKWEQTASIFELDKAEGEIYTEEEKQAGSGTRQLTQNSPAPKNMIAVKVPKGKAYLLSFSMYVNK